jgi:propanol-preferring alcohol dehydrogenase
VDFINRKRARLALPANGHPPHAGRGAFIPGHVGASFVAKLGPGVKNLKEGDGVGIGRLHSACGHCEFCLTGWETFCHPQQISGYSVNGSFTEFALGDADYLGRIPEMLSFTDAAPILCAGAGKSLSSAAD